MMPQEQLSYEGINYFCSSCHRWCGVSRIRLLFTQCTFALFLFCFVWFCFGGCLFFV
jgi:hypothetical protein